MTIDDAKKLFGADFREMLRLTRLLLNSNEDQETRGSQLKALMGPLAARIKACNATEAIRTALDHIILEDIQERKTKAVGSRK